MVIFGEMSADDTVDVLEHIPEARKKQLLAKMRREDTYIVNFSSFILQ